MSQQILHYALSLSNWRAHEFTVSISIPSHHTDTLTLALPSWIPGSYMVRDFAKNIITLSAKCEISNSLLAAEKRDKQTWVVNSKGKACVIEYVVYANDLSIRSAFINDQYGFINGTSAFLQVSELENAACHLDVNLPGADEHVANWQTYTSMPVRDITDTQKSWHFHCADYSEFIDHPMYIGIADTYQFDVDNVTFTLLFSGNNNIDYARIARDLAPICQHHLNLFGKPYPVENYLFMTLLADNGFGGLEHNYSTALLYPRFDLPMVGESDKKTDSYITFLSLCSHEFFHTWHVKRIKPSVMITPNLASETYTNQLWIYEGFTSFYDDLTLARAGVIEAPKYLDILAQNISRLLQNNGRTKQSAAQSSFEAWTKFYKQDASATNNIVSYYTKGGIIAFGLDLFLRKESDNTVCLDSLMRLLWEHYGKKGVGTPDSVIQSLCLKHFNIDVLPYLNRVVYGTEDVALDALVGLIGLNYYTRASTSFEDKGGATSSSPITHQFGATLKPAPIGLTVVQVFEGLAAMQSGILLNDIVIALDGQVVNQAKLQRLLDSAQRQTVEITLIRDGRLLCVDLPVTPARQDMAYFEVVDSEKLNAWLTK